jgi:hypothetical protein
MKVKFWRDFGEAEQWQKKVAGGILCDGLNIMAGCED